MKKTVYVLGNITNSKDNLPPLSIPKLQKLSPAIDFIPYDPTEEFPPNIKKLILLDTVSGIDKVSLFDDLDDFLLSKTVSVHDFDLPLQLGILHKLGKIAKVTIIGIPQNRKYKNIKKDLEKIFTSI